MNLLAATAAHSLASEPSIGASLMKMIFGLAAVIVSILVVSKLLQFVRRGTPRRAASGTLEVLSRQSLGKGLQLAVVRFGGREVLVGVAGQQISFHEPAGSSLEDELALFDEEPEAPPSAFAPAPITSRVAELRAGLLRAPNPGTTSAASFLDRLRDATARR